GRRGAESIVRTGTGRHGAAPVAGANRDGVTGSSWKNESGHLSCRNRDPGGHLWELSSLEGWIPAFGSSPAIDPLPKAPRLRPSCLAEAAHEPARAQIERS